MEIATTVAFTGYRTSKLLRVSNNRNILTQLPQELEQTILNLYNQGYTTYLSGMADGFDMLAAEAVLRLKESHSDIKLVAVIPFQGQELEFTTQDKRRYKAIFENADRVVLTADNFHKRAYLDRNDYLLAHSSAVICYYNGERGGTMYTVNRAIKREMKLINLCPKKS